MTGYVRRRRGLAQLSKALSYRRDVDGLRCLAITPVVIFHTIAWACPSGYLGVDVFFVISGYLIGGILFREIDERSFSVANFYARRARRILPALFAVVVVTIILGLALLSTAEARALAGSAVWALLAASNIFFWRHIDYFSPTADENPLLMTWSLAVEEQFYILFPALLLITAGRARAYRLHIVLIICALSLAFSLYESYTSPIASFYLLPSRIWELGVGAALAIIHYQAGQRQLPGMKSTALGIVGLLMLAASFYMFDEDTPIPGVAALLPVGATAILIHTRDSFINRRLLSHSLFVYIGLLSYSWYLWHWPLLTYVRVSANGGQTDTAMCAIALLSLLLAHFSLKYIETPFRRSALPTRAVLVRSGVALVGAIVVIQSLKMTDMLPARLPALVDQIEAEIRGGEGCMSPFGSDQPAADPHCSPDKSVVALIGDSHAAALAPGLERYVALHGASLKQLTKPSCSPLLGYGRTSDLAANAASECIAFMRAALNEVKSDQNIEIIVLAGLWPPLDDPKIRTEVGQNLARASGADAIRIGLTGFVDELRTSGKTVILVQDVPLFEENAARLLLSRAIPLRHLLGDAASAVPLSNRPAIENLEPTRVLLADLAKSRQRVHVVDPFRQFCEGERCAIAEEGLPLFRDKQHLSYVGSMLVDWNAIPIKLASH